VRRHDESDVGQFGALCHLTQDGDGVRHMSKACRLRGLGFDMQSAGMRRGV
jgi:hypothetical protein